MSPPVKTFPPSDLPKEIQRDTTGRKRKPAPGRGREPGIELGSCEPLAMSQYECFVPRPEERESRVQCFEVVRFFRR